MKLTTYKPQWGDLVAGWVTSDRDLRWLAPGTPPPLCAEKISAWKKPGGTSYVGIIDGGPLPVCYGELNPMQSDLTHFWLGHILVDPAMRGLGIGRRLVGELLQTAFLARGAGKVSLVVFPDNPGAVQCYRRCGFRFVGEERHRFQSGQPKYRLLRFEADPSCLIHKPSRAREEALIC